MVDLFPRSFDDVRTSVTEAAAAAAGAAVMFDCRCLLPAVAAVDDVASVVGRAAIELLHSSLMTSSKCCRLLSDWRRPKSELLLDCLKR